MFLEILNRDHACKMSCIGAKYVRIQVAVLYHVHSIIHLGMVPTNMNSCPAY